ncbi:hypothetical protein BJY52DRAFT_1302955 [Lactarius psammicola]|nr:hypothetical protein BJY52DRAFT_1302955 [Lactarius psammicola]
MWISLCRYEISQVGLFCATAWSLMLVASLAPSQARHQVNSDSEEPQSRPAYGLVRSVLHHSPVPGQGLGVPQGSFLMRRFIHPSYHAAFLVCEPFIGLEKRGSRHKNKRVYTHRDSPSLASNYFPSTVGKLYAGSWCYSYPLFDCRRDGDTEHKRDSRRRESRAIDNS